MTEASHPYNSDDWIRQTCRMLDSFARWTGNSLIPRIDPQADSAALFHAEFVVVAHGIQDDPLLNFGNLAALSLWSMNLEQFLGTPSRKTAEPVHRSERAKLMQRTRQDGFIDDYSGIRIASDGSRFRIHRAIVWNVLDEDGEHAGQAATFSEWTSID
jgi:hypothetical protein